MIDEECVRSDAELASLYGDAMKQLSGADAATLYAPPVRTSRLRVFSFRVEVTTTPGPPALVLMPMTLARHRSVEVAPPFEALLPYEVAGLRALTLAIQHGRSQLYLTADVVDPKVAHEPLYAPWLLHVAESLADTEIVRDRDGIVTVKSKDVHPSIAGKSVLDLMAEFMAHVARYRLDPFTGDTL